MPLPSEFNDPSTPTNNPWANKVIDSSGGGTGGSSPRIFQSNRSSPARVAARSFAEPSCGLVCCGLSVLLMRSSKTPPLPKPIPAVVVPSVTARAPSRSARSSLMPVFAPPQSLSALRSSVSMHHFHVADMMHSPSSESSLLNVTKSPGSMSSGMWSNTGGAAPAPSQVGRAGSVTGGPSRLSLTTHSVVPPRHSAAPIFYTTTTTPQQPTVLPSHHAAAAMTPPPIRSTTPRGSIQRSLPSATDLHGLVAMNKSASMERLDLLVGIGGGGGGGGFASPRGKVMQDESQHQVTPRMNSYPSLLFNPNVPPSERTLSTMIGAPTSTASSLERTSGGN